MDYPGFEVEGDQKILKGLYWRVFACFVVDLLISVLLRFFDRPPPQTLDNPYQPKYFFTNNLFYWKSQNSQLTP